MSQNVLVVGSGGREHALAERLRRSESVARVALCPGNAGTRAAGFSSVTEEPLVYARRERPDLVVIGPEGPLCEGLADALGESGLLAYGPSQAAARLEGSKAFMKAFAARHGLRTARYVTVGDARELDAALAGFVEPPVIKASGLCAGKGVVVAESFEQARGAAEAMLSGRAFGAAGQQIVIEERLFGEEVSVHAICDGSRALVLPPIQDHKRIGEGDTGPNTGGMGTYGPARVVGPELLQRIEREIVDVTLAGLRAEGHPFRGTLFAGLMITPAGEPVLIEFNVRFGDPETQVLMNLLEGDFAALLTSAAQGELNPRAVSCSSDFGLCVVLAAAGYPEAPRKGDVVTGLERAGQLPGVSVYHAGTIERGSELVTDGGRVLSVTAIGADLNIAAGRAYAACDEIRFSGMQLRRDIGFRDLQRSGAARPQGG